jgi:hypothetical protein
MKAEIYKFKTPEMWLWRRLEKEIWKNRINYKDFLRMMNEPVKPDQNYMPNPEELGIACAERK